MPNYKSVRGKWGPADVTPAPQEKAVIKEEPKPEPVVEAPKVEEPRRRRPVNNEE